MFASYVCDPVRICVDIPIVLNKAFHGFTRSPCRMLLRYLLSNTSRQLLYKSFHIHYSLSSIVTEKLTVLLSIVEPGTKYPDRFVSGFSHFVKDDPELAQ